MKITILLAGVIFLFSITMARGASPLCPDCYKFSPNITIEKNRPMITGTTNQEKLDRFLTRVKGKETVLDNDEKYEELLDSVLQKIDALGNKYKNNTQVSQMVQYLSTRVRQMKDDVGRNKGVDRFFCELGGGCGNEVIVQ